MHDPGEEALVARAVARGLLTPAQVADARRAQAQSAARGEAQGLLAALVAARHLRPDQAAALRGPGVISGGADDATVTHAGDAPHPTAAAPAPTPTPAPAGPGDATVTHAGDGGQPTAARPATPAPGARPSGRLGLAPGALAPGARVGAYEVERELARGGMGAVLVARHVALGRRVALKVMLGHDPRHLERFRIEAQATAKLRHPNIVAVHEAGVADGRPYLVMDLVDGPSLAERIARDGPLPVREAVALAETLARALGAAHAAGVLHRDIKPGNILLRREDGAPLLTDFGLAKDAAEAARLTKTGQALGTPAFMPPEQATGQLGRVGPASDVYALGATLHVMLTGEPPFAGEHALNILVAIVRTPPASLRLARPEVDPALDALVLRCLAKDPAARYASAEALADDLRRWLDGAALAPAPRRAGARGPLAAGLAALGVLAALGLALAAGRGGAPGAAPVSTRQAPSPAPPPLAPRRDPGPAPADEAAAAAELAHLDRAPPAARIARLEAWLERWPAHPRAADARRALARACLEAPRRLLPHEGCRGAALLRDGARAVTWGGPEVALWDLATGARLRAWRVAPPALDVAPAPGGAGLVLVDGTGVAAWLDLAPGAPGRRPLHDAGRERPLSRAALSPDGARLALGGPDGHARVVDARDGRLLHELAGHGNPVRALALDDRHLLTGCGRTLARDTHDRADNAVRVWDLATGRLLRRIELGASCEGLGLSPDGARVAVASAWRVALHDVASGAPLGELDARAEGEAAFLSGRAHRGIVQGAAFVAGGAWLVSVSGDTLQAADCELAVWDAATRRELLRSARPAVPCYGLAVDQGARRALVASLRGAEVWDLAGLDERPR